MAVSPNVVDEAVAIYERHLRSYRTMAQHVHDTIRNKCDTSAVHTIEYREKNLEKFRRKALKKENGEYKYNDPLNEITDLAGVRVIVFVRDTVNEICSLIADMYDVKEQEDVGERVYKQGRFGYQSIHMLVELDKKLYIGADKKIKRAVCEIQVRTILQHAWAELEHDIQYKGDQVPSELAKRFSALAGLLEIADGEFQRIQADSTRLKDVVQANLLNDLTQQGFASQRREDADGAGESANVHRVRDLVASGRYQEAMEWYNQTITGEPNNHTALIGRAKLLFLLGDATKALADLEAAGAMAPNDPVIARTRTLIENGDIESLRAQGAATAGSGDYDPKQIGSAFKALEEGNGVQAFDDFTTLEASGYNKAFAIFNKAMACAVEEDTKGARDFLNSLKLIPTTPMSVNINALHHILDVMDGSASEESLKDTREALELVPNFSLQQSHLHHLLKGLRHKGVLEAEQIIQNLAFLGPIDETQTN